MTPPNTTGAQALSDEQIADLASDYQSTYTHGGTTFDAFDSLGFARALLALSSRGQDGAVAPRWIIARQSVINDVPGSRPSLGYTVFAESFTTFATAEQASEALRELNLPLGWVYTTTDQEPWVSLFPPAAPGAAVAAREQEVIEAAAQQAGALITLKDGSYGNVQAGAVIFTPSEWQSFCAALASREEAPEQSAKGLTMGGEDAA
jgi:hypothetical protein